MTYSRGQRSEDDNGTPRLKFCSIPSFKGMESEAAILILGRLADNSVEGSRPFDPQNARAYAYTGMSHTRGSLAAPARDDLSDEMESWLRPDSQLRARGLGAGASRMTVTA